ncbi:MAG: hypothetical protein WD826_03680 [Actinomycetota bacterium]
MADEPRPVVGATIVVVLVLSPLVSLFGPRVVTTVPGDVTRGYRAVYLIDDRAGDRPSVRTEVVGVHRPYGGRIENRPGRPPGGEVSSGRVSNREFGWQLDDGGALQFGFRRPSGGPTRDVSYAAMRDAADAGVVVQGGAGSALGRRCTWFFFRDPFPEPLAPPTDDDRIEACVDPAGVLLREAWIIDGKVQRITETVALETTAPGPDAFLEGRVPDPTDVTQPEALEIVGKQVFVGDDVDEKRTELDLAQPSGWRRDRNARVVQAGATGRATQFASLAYVRGNELVIVEIGMQADHEPTWLWNEGESIEIPDASKARVLYFGDHVEVRVGYDDGFARINAPTRAIAVAFATRAAG